MAAWPRSIQITDARDLLTASVATEIVQRISPSEFVHRALVTAVDQVVIPYLDHLVLLPTTPAWWW